MIIKALPFNPQKKYICSISDNPYEWVTNEISVSRPVQPKQDGQLLQDTSLVCQMSLNVSAGIRNRAFYIYLLISASKFSLNVNVLFTDIFERTHSLSHLSIYHDLFTYLQNLNAKTVLSTNFELVGASWPELGKKFFDGITIFTPFMKQLIWEVSRNKWQSSCIVYLSGFDT